MSRSLTLVTFALVALSSTPSSVLATDSSSLVVVEKDQTTAPAFQLNLARRFSSTVEQLKKRQGGGGGRESKVSRAKERSISDELVALLKLAGAGQAYNPASPSQHTAAAVKPSAVWDPSQHTQAASKPTGSRRPQNNNNNNNNKGQHALAGKPYEKPKSGPSAIYNSHLASPTDSPSTHSPHKPKPSASCNNNGGVATHAAQPPSHSSDSSPSKPSKSLSYSEHTMAAVAPPVASSVADHVAKRGVKLLEEVQKRIQEEPWENLDSQLLCPLGETACPIFPRMGTYECVDTSSELENCGGCASRSQGEDCTQLKGVLGLACQSGKCNVFTCQPGYNYLESGRDGHGVCIEKGSRRNGGGFFGSRMMVKKE
ncbi:hypothetical protein JCM5350_000741 [Sporobolomyces pararoseus]